MNSALEQITTLMYLLCFVIISTNSRTSTLWKLNSDKTKVVEASSFHQVMPYPEGPNGVQFIIDDDPVFNIITSTVHLGQSWVKERVEYYCTNCPSMKTDKAFGNTTLFGKSPGTASEPDEVLDCGKPVNFTYYDNLVGVLNRNKHPNVPEPQAALIFTKKSKKEFDVDALERRLKKAKREKPKSVQLYNQIGNFWRIKGDAEKAIECFRRALAVSPYNAEVLLNLARVLFALQYLDDAIFLTRRSLEVQPPDKGAWQQYFTLGEILKAYGHYQEAAVHMKHTLQLKPGFEPADRKSVV